MTAVVRSTGFKKETTVHSGMKTFLGLPHLLVPPENDRFGLVDAALAKKGLKRRLGLTLPRCTRRQR